MKIHAIRTGSVRIKTAQAEGRGRALRRRLAVLGDRQWTQWLPTYAWAIEHSEGVIVVDTGQGMHLLESRRSLHHVSVVVEDQGVAAYFLSGDASYDQRLMLAGRVDGISADDEVAGATLRAIGQFARSRRVVYLPTHDPESAARLADRTCVPSVHL